MRRCRNRWAGTWRSKCCRVRPGSRLVRGTVQARGAGRRAAASHQHRAGLRRRRRRGRHYFAMQYIEGQTLDVVIDQVRRLRGQATRADRAATQAANCDGRPETLGWVVAEGLIAGSLHASGTRFARARTRQPSPTRRGQPCDPVPEAGAHSFGGGFERCTAPAKTEVMPGDGREVRPARRKNLEQAHPIGRHQLFRASSS